MQSQKNSSSPHTHRYTVPSHYTPTHTQSEVVLPFIFAGGRDREGEFLEASSASVHSHLQNTQSQHSHQSILQLRQGTERAERERNIQRWKSESDSVQSAASNRASPVLLSQENSGHIPNLLNHWDMFQVYPYPIKRDQCIHTTDQTNVQCFVGSDLALVKADTGCLS